MNDSRDVLFEHWSSIPKLTFLDMPKSVMTTHNCRLGILRILREGLSEKVNGKLKTRHALNAIEIRDLLVQNMKIKLSKTGIYFHLKTLEDVGLITTVSQLLEGRHKVAYYGRSAQHMFVRDPETRRQKYDARFRQLTKLVKAVDPGINVSSIRSISKQFHDLKREREQALGEWLVENEKLILSKGLEVSELFEILKILDSVNPRYVDLLGGILDNIGIKVGM